MLLLRFSVYLLQGDKVLTDNAGIIEIPQVTNKLRLLCLPIFSIVEVEQII